MSREEYVQDCWDRAHVYMKGILLGSIKTSKWVKLAIERHVDDLERDDLEYDITKIEKVFSFFYFLNIEPNKRFHLLPYQIFIIIALFGFYWKETGLRKHRYAFVFCGRKNGKTTFIAALQLYAMLADGVYNPQSILVASTKAQASIALNAASELVQNSPMLRKRLDFFGPQDSRHRIVFADKTKPGFCKTYSAFADRLDGLNPSFSILDEVHTYRDYSLFNVIKSGIGTRDNPMIFLISTAGFNLDSICFDMVKSGKFQLENPETRDDSFFYMLYTLDDTDDPSDPSNWYKSNPALFELISLDYLVNEYEQTKLLPVQKANFMTKNLNVFTEEPEIWVSREELEKRFKDLNLDDFEGMDCYIGADFSKVRDFSAITLTFEKDEHLYSFPFFFFANNDEDIQWKGKHSLRHWIDKGYIIQGDKPTIDYDLIYEMIAEWQRRFNIIQFNFDPYNKREIIPKLITDLGINCKDFRQTTIQFNDPIKLAETKILNGEITFQNNPVLLWNFGNVIIWMDGYGNVKFTKDKKENPIDGAISTIMSIGAWQKHNAYGEYDLSAFSNE